MSKLVWDGKQRHTPRKHLMRNKRPGVLMAHVLEGAVIVENNADSIAYRHSCPYCGWKDSNKKMCYARSGILNTGGFCPRCGESFSVRIDLRS